MYDKLEQLLNGQHYKKLQEMMFSSIAEQYQLSLLEIKVLVYLDTHQQKDTAKDIVNLHFFTKSNVSKSIDDLIARGYLFREHDEQDRRYIHLRVKEQAKPIIDATKEKQGEIVAVLFQGITKEEVEVIQKVALKITQNISEAVHSSSAGCQKSS